MKARFVLAMLIAVALGHALPEASSSHDWWPMVDGSEFVYVNAENDTMYVSYAADADSMTWTLTDGMCEVRRSFIETTYGSLVQKGSYSDCLYEGLWYALSLLVLPGEPALGSSWTHDGYIYSEVGLYYLRLGLGIGSSLVPVDVPAGSYDCMSLSMYQLTGYGFTTYGVMLAKGLGPVIIGPGNWELVSHDGLVGAEARSWGEVKSMFR